MNFKYIQEIQNSTEATMLLYDAIGRQYKNGECVGGIDGSMFAYEFQYLQDKVEKINVRINSVGGSVLDGYSIISTMLNSTIPVDVYIDGMAASIAAVIAMCGDKVCIMDYGTLMIHNPSGEADQVILDFIKNTLVTILKNRTDFSADEISKLMDKETWFNAKQAVKNGMADEIINSKVKVKVDKKTNIYNLFDVYNSIIQKTNKKDMIQIINKLNLEEDATEEMVIEAIESLQNKIVEPTQDEELKSTISELENKIEAINKEKEELVSKLDAYNAEKEEAKRIKIETLVNSYVVSGKLKEEEKESTIKMANFDFEGTKNMLDKIGSKTANHIISEVVNLNSEKSGWNFRDYEKKDPKALLEIKNTNPELYEEMYNSYYKK
jgi:ATP-dependent protease ClpP protease subunit/tetrahydromethanopterin S-methyltransferase subunit G